MTVFQFLPRHQLQVLIDTAPVSQPPTHGTNPPESTEFTVRTQPTETVVRDYPRRNRKKREWFEPGKN